MIEDFQEKLIIAENHVRKIDDQTVKTKLYKEIENAKTISSLTVELNTIIIDGVITDEANTKQLNQFIDKLEVVKSFNETIFNSFTETVNEAESQLSVLELALHKINEADQSMTRDTYKTAKSHVDKVINDNQKKELNKRLTEIDEKLLAIEEELLKEQFQYESEFTAIESPSNETQISESASQNASTESGSSLQSENNSTTQTKQQPKPSEDNTSIESSAQSAMPALPPATENKDKEKSESESEDPTDWDAIGEQLEDHEWNHIDSGEIDPDGNTWDSWE